MGGDKLVTRVKIGAFEMMLNPKFPDQERAAEQLAKFDEFGNHDGVFSQADVFSNSTGVAVATLAEVLQPGVSDFHDRLKTVVDVTNSAKPLKKNKDEIASRFEAGGWSRACEASKETWDALGESEGLYEFGRGYLGLFIDYENLKRVFPEAFYIECYDTYEGKGAFCVTTLKDGSIYGSLDDPLQRAVQAAIDIFDVRVFCKVIYYSDSDYSSDKIRLAY